MDCRGQAYGWLTDSELFLFKIDTPSGSYVSAAKVKLPSKYAKSNEGLVLEHDL